MKYYAIRHKPTGHFLPAIETRYSCGGTFVEPSDPTKKMVRLFKRRQHAQSALANWLKGTMTAEYERRGDQWGVDDVRYIKTTPQPHRKAEDMEIVEVILTVNDG